MMDKLISESIRCSINKLIKESDEDYSCKDENIVKEALFAAIKDKGSIEVIPNWDYYDLEAKNEDDYENGREENYEFFVENYGDWSFRLEMVMHVYLDNYSYCNGDYWTPPSCSYNVDIQLCSDVNVEYIYDTEDIYYEGKITIGKEEFKDIVKKYFYVD